jgi:hypothetical protein
MDWKYIANQSTGAGHVYALNWAIANATGIERARARILLGDHLVSQGQKALDRGELLEARDYFRLAQAQTPNSIALKWRLQRIRRMLRIRLISAMLLWVGLIIVSYVMFIG